MASTARTQEVRRREDPAERDETVPDSHEGDAILRHLTDFLDAFMWQADPATLGITFVTTSVQDLLGHPASRWVGSPERWGANIHPEDRDRVVEAMRSTGADGLDREIQFRAEHADGRTLVLRLVVRLVSPPSGENELWGITHDITADARTAETLRATQERYRTLSVQAAELRKQALEDPLTKLPNRLLFDDRAGALLRNAQRAGKPFAVLLMDLDRFKAINDTLGHQAGDAVLREVALRARICVRGQDTAARLGGDEFAALLPEVDEAGAVRVASRIVGAMKSPFEVDGTESMIGVSIGIALFPRHGSAVEELLAHADVAMYRAKEAGGGYALATPDDEMPSAPGRRRRRRWGARRLIIGFAAVLAILAGALSPAAHHHSSQRESASRLDAATAALQGASSDEVVDVVASAERTLSEIPWKDVSGPEVTGALHRLQRMLTGIKSGVPSALARRVDRLLASIREAELVARFTSTPKPSPVPALIPKAETKKSVAPAGESSDEASPAPRPVPTALVPKRS